VSDLERDSGISTRAVHAGGGIDPSTGAAAVPERALPWVRGARARAVRRPRNREPAHPVAWACPTPQQFKNPTTFPLETLEMVAQGRIELPTP